MLPRGALLLLLVASIASTAFGGDCRTSGNGCTGLVNICMPDFTGATTGWTCTNLAATCTSCSGTCFAGTCLTCPSTVCGANTGVDASVHAQLSLAFTAAVGSSTSISSSTSVTFSAYIVTGVAADSALTTISGAYGYARTTLIQIGSSASAQAAIVISTGNTIWVDSISSVDSVGAIIVQSGASINATAVTVASGTTHSISFQASSATTASVSYTNVTYNKITLAANAALNLVGKGVVTLPSTTAALAIDSSATIRVAGGVLLRGVLGTAVMTVGGVSQAAAIVQVKAQETLTTSGAIAGSASAWIQVYGSLQFGGVYIYVSIDIQGSASITSESGTTNSGELHITTSTFNQSGSAVYVTSAGAIRIDYPSSNIRFRQFANCSADSTIYAQVSSVASLSNGQTGVVFTFDATTTVRANMKCNVVLYDSTGATLTMVNSASASGRRLLASQGTSSWNADGTVTYTTGSGNGASSTSSSLAVGMMAGAAALAMIGTL